MVVAVSVAILGALGAGCGSSPESEARERTATSPTTTGARGTPAGKTPTTPNRRPRSGKKPTPGNKAKSTTSRPRAPKGPALRVALTAPTHTPAAGEPWPYTIHVTDRDGKPVQGTATVTVVTADGKTVDGVGTFDAKNVIRMTYRWPRADRGLTLVFKVRVEAVGGAETARYDVRVR